MEAASLGVSFGNQIANFLVKWSRFLPAQEGRKEGIAGVFHLKVQINFAD